MQQFAQILVSPYYPKERKDSSFTFYYAPAARFQGSWSFIHVCLYIPHLMSTHKVRDHKRKAKFDSHFTTFSFKGLCPCLL
jgi:hypothetical protein